MDYKNTILIAKIPLSNTMFGHSVIYVHEHNEDGTAGFILNWQLEPAIASTYSKSINWPYPDLMYFGGPVKTEFGHILHSNDYAKVTTKPLNEHVSYTNENMVITDLSRALGPSNFMLSFGHCAWGNGQLEHEVENGAWAVTKFDERFMWQRKPKLDYWDYGIHLMAENEVKLLLADV